MGSEIFQYVFTDGTATDTINVTVATPATDSTGYGLGYAVTNITGSVEGAAITGESGTGGSEQTDADGNPFDNTVFASDASGSTQFGASGSMDGLDVDGIEFTASGSTYNVYYGSGTFAINNVTTNSNNDITLVSSTAPCYCPGTLILTNRGEMPVDTLVIGDTVVTASGQHRSIKWVGSRSYAGRFLAANPNVQPIRFRAGSLGEDLPRRDLLVSPEHAMFLDGLLIPARCLMNGTTIVQERGLARVDYFHVELDSHDVLLAEGAASESYLDDDSRGMFHNASEYAELYPGAPAPGGFCAPKVDEGYQLQAIRQRLAALAGEIAAAA